MLHNEHGASTSSMILFNLVEYQVRNGRDGYRWDGEAWFGKDLDRLTIKSEGEGVLGGRNGTFRSEEHTSELQSLMRISYAVFCLKKKTNKRPLKGSSTT